MAAVKPIEDLRIWKDARRLVSDVYCAFGAGTEAECDFGLRNQIQRCAVSVMNNVAEGFERSTDVEFARFLDIAKGSCGEVRCMYYIAEDIGYVPKEAAAERRNTASSISRGIASLTTHLRNK
jgi:four helix bundle protein